VHITENNLLCCHANPVDSVSALQQCHHQNSLLETGMGTGCFWHLLEMKWGTAYSELPELLIFFVFLSFSAHFHFIYLLHDWNFSSASYTEPFPPASSDAFLLHRNFNREMWD